MSKMLLIDTLTKSIYLKKNKLQNHITSGLFASQGILTLTHIINSQSLMMLRMKWVTQSMSMG